MLEDVYEVVAGLAGVDVVLALCPAPQPDAVAVTWPGTPTIALPDNGANPVIAGLNQLGDLGYAEAAVLAADSPDLPGLLIGKLWRALGRAEVAVCPAQGGGLVALAARLPVSGWVDATGVDLDSIDAVHKLRARAPRRADVAVGPGWHRLRVPGDLELLDPGLEGWEATRAVLGSRAYR